MYFTSTEIHILDEAQLRSFLEKRIPEGHHLDYKKELGRGIDAKREFLKDITAFANANGGDIIIGADEPNEKLKVEHQLHGVDNGDSLAQDLERVASSSVDPRIPGLLIQPIPLQNGKHAIVIHVPPSNTRPFRVNHSGHVNFYIRHSESVFPMNTYDIRETVLSSVTAESKAKEYLSKAETEVRDYTCKGEPFLLLQAMPLIPSVQPWNVLNDQFFDVIRDASSKRRKHFPNHPLESLVAPTPTIEGVKGRNSREDPNWNTEIHRNGYISAVDRKPLQPVNLGGERGILPTLHNQGICELFQSFAHFCTEVLESAETDSPYVLRCRLVSAKGVYLLFAAPGERYHGPWEKQTIDWPDEVRQVGEDFARIAERWCQLLFHAFGLEVPH